MPWRRQAGVGVGGEPAVGLSEKRKNVEVAAERAQCGESSAGWQLEEGR